jgi:hypothetical protein
VVGNDLIATAGEEGRIRALREFSVEKLETLKRYATFSLGGFPRRKYHGLLNALHHHKALPRLLVLVLATTDRYCQRAVTFAVSLGLNVSLLAPFKGYL